MRKLFVFMLTLLCAVGAWADVSELKVSDGSNTHYYLIKSYRSGKFAKWAGDDAQLLQSSYLTDANLWYVTADGTGYKLCNKATTNKYATTSSFTAEGATVYIAENKYKSGYWCVSLTPGQTAQCWDDQQGKIGFYAPTATDNEGTSWTFEEVTEDINKKNLSILMQDAASAIGDDPGFYPQSAYDDANAVYTNASSTSADYQSAFNTLAEAQIKPGIGKYYQIHSALPGFSETRAMYSSNDSQFKWKKLENGNSAFYWTITPDGDNYIFTQFLNGQSISAPGTLSCVSAQVELVSLGNGQFNINCGGTFHANGHSGGTGTEGTVISWAGAKNSASSWYIREVTMTTEVAKHAINQRITAAGNIGTGEHIFGNHPGQYASESEILSAKSEAQTVYDNALATLEECRTALSAINTKLVKNIMEVGKYYRIQNTALSTYTGVQRSNERQVRARCGTMLITRMTQVRYGSWRKKVAIIIS